MQRIPCELVYNAWMQYRDYITTLRHRKQLRGPKQVGAEVAENTDDVHGSIQVVITHEVERMLMNKHV